MGQVCKKRHQLSSRMGASASFNSYAEYLAAFEQTWKGRLGQQIRDYLARVDTDSSVESEPRFQRRVLDVHLMRCGGRKL